MDHSAFRRSDNIEDRRRRPVAPEISQGVFGAGLPVPNVFDNGLLTGLRPEDFIQNPAGEHALDDDVRNRIALQLMGRR